MPASPQITLVVARFEDLLARGLRVVIDSLETEISARENPDQEIPRNQGDRTGLRDHAGKADPGSGHRWSGCALGR